MEETLEALDIIVLGVLFERFTPEVVDCVEQVEGRVDLGDGDFTVGGPDESPPVDEFKDTFENTEVGNMPCCLVFCRICPGSDPHHPG